MKSVEWEFFCFIFNTHIMLCCGWTYAMAMAQGISCFSWLIQQGTDQQECCDWGCSHKNSRLVGGFSEDKANRRTEALCHCSGWCLFKFVQGWGGQTCWPCLIVSPIDCFCTQVSKMSVSMIVCALSWPSSFVLIWLLGHLFWVALIADCALDAFEYLCKRLE